MPFGGLAFFADAGNGDQFFVSLGCNNAVYVWEHESDSRTWLAATVLGYLEAWMRGELPHGCLHAEARSGQPAPWASLGWDKFTIASGATRVRRVGVSTDEGRSSSGGQVSRSVSYVELELGGADPKGVADFVLRAFQRCADGTVAHVQGPVCRHGRRPVDA
jgi:hypothetical protein